MPFSTVSEWYVWIVCRYYTERSRKLCHIRYSINRQQRRWRWICLEHGPYRQGLQRSFGRPGIFYSQICTINLISSSYPTSEDFRYYPPNSGYFYDGIGVPTSSGTSSITITRIENNNIPTLINEEDGTVILTYGQVVQSLPFLSPGQECDDTKADALKSGCIIWREGRKRKKVFVQILKNNCYFIDFYILYHHYN